jgi:Domain of unknown function (DUF4336)
MTAVRLDSGSLWVHAPVAATKECIKLVSELGNVEHIVLPTTGTAAKFTVHHSKRHPSSLIYHSAKLTAVNALYSCVSAMIHSTGA